jgi:hypothetical protein
MSNDANSPGPLHNQSGTQIFVKLRLGYGSRKQKPSHLDEKPLQIASLVGFLISA